jgi:osmotically-inducible protein OsmY
MSTVSLSRADIRLRDDVLRQLEWDAAVDASAVGVTAGNGIVTLTGFIDTYAGKLAAERAARRVHGVRAVANDIEVRLRRERTDPDIAADAARALALNGSIPETVQAVVHDGHITLTGTASWLYQTIDAAKAVRHVRGVRGVINRVTVAPRPVDRDVRHRIVHALHSSADLASRQLGVAVTGDRAILTGTVETWLQREIAERAAMSAPGIRIVENRITVEPRAVEGGEGDDAQC